MYLTEMFREGHLQCSFIGFNGVKIIDDRNYLNAIMATFSITNGLEILLGKALKTHNLNLTRPCA